jgi:hypothetical protein
VVSETVMIGIHLFGKHRPFDFSSRYCTSDSDFCVIWSGFCQLDWDSVEDILIIFVVSEPVYANYRWAWFGVLWRHCTGARRVTLDNRLRLGMYQGRKQVWVCPQVH